MQCLIYIIYITMLIHNTFSFTHMRPIIYKDTKKQSGSFIDNKGNDERYMNSTRKKINEETTEETTNRLYENDDIYKISVNMDILEKIKKLEKMKKSQVMNGSPDQIWDFIDTIENPSQRRINGGLLDDWNRSTDV